MNAPSLSLEPSKSYTDAPETPSRIELKFPPISTPDYCPFSVEVEASNSHNPDMLRLSTVNKSWSLAMRTTSSSLIDKGDNEDDGDEDDFPLNEIERALSSEKVPVGLVPISSDSESSSRDESADIDSEDEGSSAIIPPSTSGAGSAHLHDRHLPCALSPRLSRTPQRQQKSPQASSAPLNSLKVLNPGVPQGHVSHSHINRMNSYNSMSGNPRTPKRGDSNALVTSNSNVVNSSAADCMCFAIEDVAAFFCPATPSRTIMNDTTTYCPMETDCFPAYEYATTPTPSGDIGGSLSSFHNFLSPRNSPLQPRNRLQQFEALFLLNSNLPRNRGHSERRKHVKKFFTVWHGNEDINTDRFGYRDDFHLLDNQRRRRSLDQPKVCYDSDPEHEVQGRWKRRAALTASKQRLAEGKPEADDEEPLHLLDEHDIRGKQQLRFQKFRPEILTHLNTDEESFSEGEESSAEDDASSYETAKCASPPPPHPVAPRNSDSKISFDFGKNLATVNVDGESDIETESGTRQCGISANIESKSEDQTGTFIWNKSHRREVSLTSLSTTGHSRFHTIPKTSEQIQEESVSSESSSAGFSSLSGPTLLHGTQHGGLKQKHVLPSYFKSNPTHWTEFQLLFSRNVDEDSVKSHVHELSNVRFPLVWHPRAVSNSSSAKTKAQSEDKAITKDTSNGDIYCPTSVKIASLSSNSSSSRSSEMRTTNRKGTPFPISVHGAFEVGAHLEHMVVQPKFTWMPLAQPHRIDKGEDANHRELFLNGSAPPQVELLSIIRVTKATPTQLDRKLYPYARADKTCIVNTNDANHPIIVLEARTTQERDWLVFSLKLIVARLASIIITRDEDMLHEFFSPYSALMQLEEDEESASSDSATGSKKLDEATTSTIECAATPTAACEKAVMLIDGEGSNDYVFPQDIETDDNDVFNDCTSDSSSVVDLGDLDTDGDDDDAECDQHRDDRENEDSIRARNSGAYAILKRSLTATGPLYDYDSHYHHEQYVPRTFSY